MDGFLAQIMMFGDGKVTFALPDPPLMRSVSPHKSPGTCAVTQNPSYVSVRPR